MHADLVCRSLGVGRIIHPKKKVYVYDVAVTKREELETAALRLLESVPTHTYHALLLKYSVWYARCKKLDNRKAIAFYVKGLSRLQSPTSPLL